MILHMSSIHWVLLAGRELLGLMLIFTGIAKIVTMREFRRVIATYQILPERMAAEFAVLLPFLEVAIAGCLISGAFVRYTGSAAAILFCAFATAVLANLVRGRRLPCGCCGASGGPSIGWNLVARNLLMALLAILITHS